jgi:hypothetical protein
VSELTWLLDPATRGLVAEGMTVADTSALAGDLLPPSREITCARPLSSPALPVAATTSGPSLRVARIYHGSLIEGPSRRSAVHLPVGPIPDHGVFSRMPTVETDGARVLISVSLRWQQELSLRIRPA